jgi:GNAT superfamily N-acetyltransferase
MNDARRFEDVEVDCLRTLHEAARAAGHPSCFEGIGSGAVCAIERQPAVAMAVGLGASDEPIRELDAVEGFFESAGVPGRFDVASIAHPGLATELALRGYQPRRVNRVLFTSIASLTPPPLAHTVERVDPDEWCTASCEGFSRTSGLLFSMLARQEGAVRVGVRLDGRLAGAGLLTRRGDVALFSAASVLEPWRGQGIHGALFRARYDIAREWGVSHAAYTCMPGSISERNALRWGLTPIGERTLYSR